MNLIEVEKRDRTGIITLNRPEKRNAMSPALIADLEQSFIEMESNSEVKVVLLKANGSVFCAGADLAYLRQLASNTYEQNLEDTNHLKRLYRRIFLLEKPVIAVVHGHAIAGGAGLAGVCDFIFAAPGAKFGYTEVRIGFVPALVSVFLSSRIGAGRARELLMSGHLFSADEMLGMGAISGVVPQDELLVHGMRYAQELAERNSATSMKLTKQLMVPSIPAFDEALDRAAEINARSRSTEDFQKGIQRFLNKEENTW